jgi:hypothetical protein
VVPPNLANCGENRDELELGGEEQRRKNGGSGQERRFFFLEFYIVYDRYCKATNMTSFAFL